MNIKEFGRNALLFLTVLGTQPKNSEVAEAEDTPSLTEENSDEQTNPTESESRGETPRAQDEERRAELEYRMEAILPPVQPPSFQAVELNPRTEIRSASGHTKSSLSAEMDSLMADHLREGIENGRTVDQISYEIDEVEPGILQIAIHPTADSDAQYITYEAGLFSVPVASYRSSSEFDCPEIIIHLSTLEEAYEFLNSKIEFDKLCAQYGHTDETLNMAIRSGNLYAMYLRDLN